MADLKEQMAQQLHDEQSKYTYFVLAAAASCIALVVQRTTGLSLKWTQLPVAFAVVAWGASFWAGCYNRAYFNTTVFANIAYLQLAHGSHPNQPRHPDMVKAAMEGVSAAAERNSAAGNRWGKWQFRMFITGGLLFLCWHIVEMATK